MSDKQELLGVLEKCYKSTRIMGETFYPEHCYRPFGDAHEPLFELLDDDTKRLVLIVCPRGFGKTTIAGLVFPSKKILFRDVFYILYISSTASKAVSDVQTLATELKVNENIQKIFGNVQGVRWAEGTGILDVNVLGRVIRVEAKGAGHQIRGLKFGHHRPDLIIIDDLEDPEQVANEERRAKLKKWLFADVLNSIDKDRTRVVMMGTVLHEDSLIQNILDEGKWESEDEDEQKNIAAIAEQFTSIRIEACNDKLEATWPSYFSTDEIRAKAAAYEKRGLLDVFFREYRNLIIPTQGATFDSTMFKHYTEDFKYHQEWESIIIVDPAKTVNIKSADSAVVGIGFNGNANKIRVRDVRNGKMHPEEIYQHAVEMADRLHTLNIAVEVTSLNEFITYPFRAFLAKKRKAYQLIELKAKGKKEERIRAMAPFYRMGAVEHSDSIQVKGPVESQLLVFPNGKLVDVIDAEAYMIEAFDLGSRLFSMETDGMTPEEKAKFEEDEFSILEKDDYDTPLTMSTV